jgi:hypothetical protein
MITTKSSDACEVRMALAGDHAERNVLIGRACDAPRGEDAGAVTVEEQRDHEVGRVGARAAGIFALRRSMELAEVELRNDIQDEVGEVAVGQPVRWRRRKKMRLHRRPRFVGLHISTRSRRCRRWDRATRPAERRHRARRFRQPDRPAEAPGYCRASQRDPRAGRSPGKPNRGRRARCRSGVGAWAARRIGGALGRSSTGHPTHQIAGERQLEMRSDGGGRGPLRRESVRLAHRGSQRSRGATPGETNGF